MMTIAGDTRMLGENKVISTIEATAYASRVLLDGGVVENIDNVSLLLDEVDKDASFVLIPSGYKAGKLYLIRPDNADMTHYRASLGSRNNEIENIVNEQLHTPRIQWDNGISSLLLEAGTISNLYINPTNLITQNVTVVAGYYTISFYGTGTIDFSGVASASITGASINERTQITFSTTAGTLQSVVTGTVLMAQIEKVSNISDIATSYIDFTTRQQDVLKLGGDATSFDSEQGAIFVELGGYTINDGCYITISDGVFHSNVIIVSINPTSNIQFNISVNGILVYSQILFPVNYTGKVGFRYNSSTLDIFANAQLIQSVPNTLGVFPPNTLSRLNFTREDGSTWSTVSNGRLKSVVVYKGIRSDEFMESKSR